MLPGAPPFFLLLLDRGFALGGAYFAAEPMAQQFTDMVYTGCDPLREDRLLRVAKILFALKECCSDLAQYYIGIERKHRVGMAKITCQPSDLAFFPSSTSYPFNGISVEFSYEALLVDRIKMRVPAKAVFRARLAIGDCPVVVKFGRRYGGAAHRALHSVHRAPELLYDGTEDSNGADFGGLKMVVMAWVEGTTLDKHKPMTQRQESNDQLRTQLHEVLAALQRRDLVHGDFRPPNVLVSENKVIQIVDFDWAGVDGQVFYPLTLNDNLVWADGVCRGGAIAKSHDKFMIEELIRMYLPS